MKKFKVGDKVIFDKEFKQRYSYYTININKAVAKPFLIISEIHMSEDGIKERYKCRDVEGIWDGSHWIKIENTNTLPEELFTL